ncbi:centromere protein N [Amazona ochrocephala]
MGACLCPGSHLLSCFSFPGGFVMDGTVAEYIRKTVRKIPRNEIKTMLQKWGFLSEKQLQTINFHQIKDSIAWDVFQLCEEIPGDIKEAAVLDMIYNHAYPNKRIWKVYQLITAGKMSFLAVILQFVAAYCSATPYHTSCKHKSCFFSFSCVTGKEMVCFDLTNFKEKIKRKLHSALGNVTINFREYEDNAVWIRIAWGTPNREPNQYRTSYVVYYSHTPYVFISLSVYRSNLPLLCQALVAASDSHDICAMELQGRCLNSLKHTVFKRSNQNIRTSYSEPLQEYSVESESDLRLVQENRKTKAKIQRMNQQLFGDDPLPKLEYAQYKVLKATIWGILSFYCSGSYIKLQTEGTVGYMKLYELETMFRSDPKQNVLHQKERFRCLVKFSSPDLLESVKSLAATSIVDTPLSPLLTSIPHKPRNHFRIKEKTD